MEKELRLARDADSKGYSASAFEFFQRVIVSDPSNDSAIYRAAKNLIEIGRISDAANYVKTIRWNAAPKPWLIEFILGEICFAQFDVEGAEQHFRNATRLNPGSTVPAIFLANCLLKREKFDEASSILQEATTAKGDLDELYLNIGLVKRAQGDYPQARFFLLKALELNPHYERAKHVLSDVSFFLNENEKI